jgi:protein-glutamine gamma-glutamyltransferase
MTDFRAAGDGGLIRFHRSLYVSLALACACLAYAEWPFLPEIAWLSIFVGLALLAAYRLEGRWSLSLGAANVVGGIIAVAILAWVLYQIVHPTGSLLRLLPWPSSLLPYLGPLVLVVIPAKLFRPKHAGDYWGLQFAGLMGVGLACALGGDVTICLLTLAYAIVTTRCLVDFQAVADRVQQPRRTRPKESLGPGWGTAALTAMTTAILAVGLSLAAPRLTDATWEYGGIANRLRTGISDDRPAIDLNVSGELTVSGEEAFTVQVVNAAGQPKLDLPPTQRWRGTTFNFYDRGKWQNRKWASFYDQRRMGRMAMPDAGPIAPFVRLRSPQRGENGYDLPSLGPQQFTVTFPYPTRKAQTFFIADPVWAPLGEPVGLVYRAPVETVGVGGKKHPWVAQQEGDIAPPEVSQLPDLATYRQVVAPLPEPDVGLPVIIDAALEEHLSVINRLPQLRMFADDLLRNLIASGRLPWSGDPPLPGQKAPPERHEAIARAFDAYLRTSGDFQYSFTLDRNDTGLDPIEDFVLNLRQGHCNRFASALALLLRCQGVPTRMVMGYHGAESQDDGTYVVRQSHAHSWVEAIIRRSGENGKVSQHWLTLDPTPDTSARSATDGLLAHFFDSVRTSAGSFVRNYLIDYQSDRQRELGNWLLSWNPSEWPAKTLANVLFWSLVGSIAVSLSWLYFRGRCRISQRATHPYGRLVELLRHSRYLKPQASWTPNELVERLADVCSNVEVVCAAHRIADRHYSERFGGHFLSPTDSDDLAIVRSHLAGRPRVSDPD